MHRLRGRIGRHFAVILGVVALVLGAFAAPGSAHDSGGFVEVLEFDVVFGTGETVTCQLDDDLNWHSIDATECAGLGDINGESVELDLAVDSHGCSWLLDEVVDGDDVIFADVRILLVEDDAHDPAVFLVDTQCVAGALDDGVDVEVSAAKDFSDNSALAVNFAISCSGTAAAPVLTSDDSHAVDPANTAGVTGDAEVTWVVQAAGVEGFEFGVVATYDLTTDGHILTDIGVEGSLSGDLATHLAGIAAAAPPSSSASCSVTETDPVGYTPNETGCANLEIAWAGGDKSCTIVNTLIPAAPAAPAATPAAAAAGAGATLPSFTG